MCLHWHVYLTPMVFNGTISFSQIMGVVENTEGILEKSFVLEISIVTGDQTKVYERKSARVWVHTDVCGTRLQVI